MCGSGTLVIEAAMKALNIAPGIRRRFTAQDWRCFQDGTFERERREAVAQVRRDAAFLAYASDNDPESVRLTQENAVKAGVASRIKVTIMMVHRTARNCADQSALWGASA